MILLLTKSSRFPLFIAISLTIEALKYKFSLDAVKKTVSILFFDKISLVHANCNSYS